MTSQRFIDDRSGEIVTSLLIHEIARQQYQDTGELDPQDIEDGAFGVVGVEQFELQVSKVTP